MNNGEKLLCWVTTLSMEFLYWIKLGRHLPRSEIQCKYPRTYVPTYSRFWWKTYKLNFCIDQSQIIILKTNEFYILLDRYYKNYKALSNFKVSCLFNVPTNLFQIFLYHWFFTMIFIHFQMVYIKSRNYNISLISKM